MKDKKWRNEERERNRVKGRGKRKGGKIVWESGRSMDGREIKE